MCHTHLYNLINISLKFSVVGVINAVVDSCVTERYNIEDMLFCLAYLICYYLFINRRKSKVLQAVYIKIDSVKFVQICEHLLKFDQASCTGTAISLLMQQIAMY